MTMTTIKATETKQPSAEGLSLATMTNAEFGVALIAEAQSRRQKEKLEKAVTEAQAIFSTIEECERQIEYFTGWKATREGQLAALRAGDFTFDKNGTITYNDKTLNRR
jgi:hypothetical protein